LWDVTDSCRAILGYVQNSSLSDFKQNRMLRRAVERELSIVGEAVSQATHHFPKLEESIGPARQIVGFRNRIVHEYAEVEHRDSLGHRPERSPQAARKVRSTPGGVGS
jgi:uncharacterized protein with HEPN domain